MGISGNRTTSTDGPDSMATEGLQEFIFFLLSHCYVFALLAMMVSHTPLFYGSLQ